MSAPVSQPTTLLPEEEASDWVDEMIVPKEKSRCGTTVLQVYRTIVSATRRPFSRGRRQPHDAGERRSLRGWTHRQGQFVARELCILGTAHALWERLVSGHGGTGPGRCDAEKCTGETAARSDDDSSSTVVVTRPQHAPNACTRERCHWTVPNLLGLPGISRGHGHAPEWDHHR